jgi:2-dehydro-3-deoxy-D-arabinonate dehydratase
MQLFQVLDAKGHLHPGIVVNGQAHVLVEVDATTDSTRTLLTRADEDDLDLHNWAQDVIGAGRTTAVSWAALEEEGRSAGWTLTLPITAPEVWGCGVTYKRSADFREEGLGIYDRIYEADRPELFYKASPSRSCGSHGPIGRRHDSQFTAAEPEVALVVSHAGAILGYTLANDVSAWDIERENPLYLPQSKIFDGCFSCGPSIVTPDAVTDPYAIELTCVVMRGRQEIFRGSASTAQLKRRFPDLVQWLRRSNQVPTGTILSTGTGIIQPIDTGLEAGDIVTISSPTLGTLRNPVALV